MQENERQESRSHSHRNIIGFDRNGIPMVLAAASHHHVHEDGTEHTEDHGQVFTHDYMEAVAAYRKTFPSKQEQLDNTPDPAVRELMLYMEQIGQDTAFDRFDRQQPQCGFGLAGICCKICNMGPCKVTAKSPRGVCGADADLIVARNLLRAAAAGAAQHGMHAREMLLMLKWAAEGKLDVEILGKYKILSTAKALGIKTERRPLRKIAVEVVDVLLEDLSRSQPETYRTIQALAPQERRGVWQSMGILPISAYHEVFEAQHISGCGTDGDWESVMRQFLRCGLVFTFSGVVATSIATDALLGVGDRVTSKVNVGALRKGWVNVAVHGHLPVLVQEIVRVGQSQEFLDKAREAGAEGIQFYGICCTGLSAMYRYAGVIPLSNAVGAELVLGTGALDLWVADVQDVYPAIMDVARCFQTAVVTTSDSARLPGAEHIGYDHHHTNVEQTGQIARRIMERAVESFRARRGVPVFIPPYEVEAEVGFSLEYLGQRYGGVGPLAQALREGRILGIVNLVGCNNPKVLYERTILEVVDVLLRNNVLVLTNGCASFPLMKLGYCQASELSWRRCGSSLREFLEPDMPPVWHVGECIDNTRSSGIFAALAADCGLHIHQMPFAFSSPEWSNEKAVDAALGFRLMGVSSYHCVEAQIHGSPKVVHFLKEATKSTLKSAMVVDRDPPSLGERIVADMRAKRAAAPSVFIS